MLEKKIELNYFDIMRIYAQEILIEGAIAYICGSWTSARLI